MGETGTAERGKSARGGGVAKSVCGAGCGAALAASVHAVHHGGAVAPVSTTSRSEVDRSGCVSRSADGVEKRGSFGSVFTDSGRYQGATQHACGDETVPQ